MKMNHLPITVLMNYDLVIQGKLGMRFFPRLNLKLGFP